MSTTDGDDYAGDAPAEANAAGAAPDVEAFDTENEEQKQRVFHFAVDKIAVTCEAKIDRCFLEFEIGGQSIEDETEEVIEKSRTKKVKKPDGTVEETEIMETVNLKMTRVKKTPVMRYMSYQKKVIKAKATEKFLFDRIEGYWHGSYADLHREFVTVRVWTSRVVGGNMLVGECQERFLDIADSKVDRQLAIRKRGGTAREETVCVVRFKCELQEWFRFQIKLQNWDLSYSKEEIEAHRKLRDSECPAPCFSTRLEFQVERSQASVAQTLCNALLCCCRSDRVSLALRHNLKTPPGGGKDAVAVLTYPGTRNWLEDEELDIRWNKGVFGGLGCCKTTVAHTRVPLQGTLDYGYILTHLNVRRDACSCHCCGACCTSCLLGIFSLTQMCFGPTCNCGRTGYSMLGRELNKDAREKQRAEDERIKKENFVNMSLSGVVTCDTVPRHRQQGSVDPARRSALLNFAQSRDHATFLVVKVIRAKGLSSVDNFKEMLNPCVAVEWLGIQKRTKTITNSVSPYWDYDVFFKMRDEHGTPRRFEDFPEQARNSKITLSIWDEEDLSRSILGFAEVDFRTIYEKREEKAIVTFSSDAKVHHLVYETKLPLEVPFTQVAEDKRSRESKKLLESEHKYLEVMFYFDRVDGGAIDNRRIQSERTEVSSAAAERKRVQQFSRARALWDESLRHVDNKDRRFFAFFGKDEYTGDFHFLPTFLKPMHPPANMKDLAEILYYVFSMEVAQKPAAEADDARRHRAIASGDPCSPIIHKDVWVWADPYFFFEKKRGDIKDHAILLCNFLLGLGLPKSQFNAFVCIGTARTKKGSLPVPHVWVMTQELFKKNRPVIRFWELKSGETFALEGPRFASVYQHDLARAASEQAEAENLRRAKSGSAGGIGAVGSSSSNGVESPAAPGESESPSEPKLGPDGQPLKDMSWDRVGRRMEDELGKFDPDDDAALLNLVSDKPVQVAAGALSGSVYTAAVEARVEVEREGAQHRLALLHEFVHEQETRFPNAKDKFWESADGRPKRRVTPYESIDVIFNHECLFANLQQPNPEVIMYELDHEKRWVEFNEAAWQECFGYRALAPHFKERAIVSILAPEREISALVTDMTARLKDGLVTHRSYLHQFETIFFEKFDFSGSVAGLETAEDYARQRLQAEQRLGMRDDSLRMLDAMRRTQDGELDTGKRRDDLAKGAAKLRAKVLRNLKDGLEYQERLFHFKHTDSNRIGDQIRTQCADLLSFPDAMHPRFQLFVNVERLAGQICPVRVLVMVTYGIAKA
jgi:hypothetical protein